MQDFVHPQYGPMAVSAFEAGGGGGGSLQAKLSWGAILGEMKGTTTHFCQFCWGPPSPAQPIPPPTPPPLTGLYSAPLR